MRAKLLCPPMIVLLLLALASCAAKGEAEADQLALSVRDTYTAAECYTGNMTVKADYGKRVYEYGVHFVWRPNGEVSMTLTSPEEVTGITVGVAQGETSLEFDQIRLETGPLGEDGLSPMDGFPFLMRCLTEGYQAECSYESLGEQETLRLCCRDPETAPSEGTEGVLWLDKETHALLRGEVRSQGVTVITCLFQDSELSVAES